MPRLVTIFTIARSQNSWTNFSQNSDLASHSYEYIFFYILAEIAQQVVLLWWINCDFCIISISRIKAWIFIKFLIRSVNKMTLYCLHFGVNFTADGAVFPDFRNRSIPITYGEISKSFI